MVAINIVVDFARKSITRFFVKHAIKGDKSVDSYLRVFNTLQKLRTQRKHPRKIHLLMFKITSMDF